MNAKIVKKHKKRELPTVDGPAIDKPDAGKPAKKAKLANGEQPSLDERVPEKPMNSLNVSIFQHFTDLTHAEEVKRMDATLLLLHKLSKTKEPEKRQKELVYTLKRLVRGCGAATNVSRAGFYTGLVAFLKAFPNDEVSMEQVFDTMQRELNVGTNIANKEDADAIVGKILSCGALLQAGRLSTVNNEHLERVVNMLLQAAKHRTYHASLGFAFLIELVEKLTVEQFESAVWPVLQRELTRPWPKQTLQTIHCLIVVQRKFPKLANAKFLKAHFGSTQLLNDDSYAYLYKIFWEHTNPQLVAHPAFELFSAHLADSPNLTEFWAQYVDPGLEAHSKLREIVTLKVATDVLHNVAKKSDARNIVTDLLGANFMHTLIEGLKAFKQKKDETMRAFYDEFFEALVECCAKLPQDAQRTAVIRRLILPPGLFSIEKYTGTRVVHQLINSLGEEGVKEMFELYKSIFLGTLTKNVENAGDSWLNFERLNAGFMLQHLLAHKSVQIAYEWREEQLKFLLTCGIFHVTAVGEICKKEAAAPFSKEFGEQCKNMFYTSLQSKVTDLQREQQLLISLVQYCNERMQQKNVAKCYRIKQFDESLQSSWKRVNSAVCAAATETDAAMKRKSKATRKSSGANKLQQVFHILLLNMGLQLFREPEMAAPAIDDLLKCMQRTQDKRQKQQAAPTNEEPAWIEVVVDLFLHLLSQNASALRNIVNALFPHLCDNLNLSAVHQILVMLDMKDGQNPLSARGAEESDDEGEEEDEVEEEAAENENEASESDEETEDDTDNDDDDDDDDDDEDEDEDVDEDGEEVSASDKLRNAISQALIESGGAAVGADDDMDSVDLNDMTEEEGRKLDEALANAFKAIKRSGDNAAQSKKSKSYRVKMTTVMHFRIRVLDLIELYLQQKPTLLITIEIMLALFNMLQFCIGDELKPLQIKAEKVLQKLTSLKDLSSEGDLTEENLADFIRLVVEKKSPAAAFESVNKMRNKCIAFLIGSVNKLASDIDRDNAQGSGGMVLALCREYMQEFMRSRNPSVNITLLSDLFRLRWRGIWDLALVLAQQGVTLQTRIFRRIQIYEILAVLYKNNELQKLDVSTTKTKLEKIEKALASHIKALASGNTNTEVSDENARVSPKELKTLLELLLHAQRANQRLQLQSSLAKEGVSAAVQAIRKHVRLENMQAYQRYCAIFKLPVLRNGDVQAQLPSIKQNGHDAPAVEEITAHSSKRKHDNKQLRQEKKQKKAQRMEAASRGLNGGFGFAQPTAADSDDDEDVTA